MVVEKLHLKDYYDFLGQDGKDPRSFLESDQNQWLVRQTYVLSELRKRTLRGNREKNA